MSNFATSESARRLCGGVDVVRLVMFTAPQPTATFVITQILSYPPRDLRAMPEFG